MRDEEIIDLYFRRDEMAITETDDKYLEWCHEMAEASSVELEEEEFTLHSKIVTLSTCTGDPGTRYVVQGIAIKN